MRNLLMVALLLCASCADREKVRYTCVFCGMDVRYWQDHFSSTCNKAMKSQEIALREREVRALERIAAAKEKRDD